MAGASSAATMMFTIQDKIVLGFSEGFLSLPLLILSGTEYGLCKYVFTFHRA